MKPYLSKFTCSKSAIKKLEKGVKYVYIVNLEDISDLFKLFIFLLWMLAEITLFTYLLAFNPFHVKLFSGGIETACQQSLCDNYPNKEFFWSVFSCSRTEYGDLLRIQSDYRKIRTRKNSAFRHLSRSEYWCKMG